MYSSALNSSASPQRSLTRRQSVWQMLKRIVKLSERYTFILSQSFVKKGKSNLLVGSTCDSVNLDFCFPGGENIRVHQKAAHQRHFTSNFRLLQKGKGGWTLSQLSEWKMSCVTSVSADRSRAHEALREWRLQSPLKWNYGALHSSLAFERFEQNAMEEEKPRQLENDTAVQTPDTKTAKYSQKGFLLPFWPLNLFSWVFPKVFFFLEMLVFSVGFWSRTQSWWKAWFLVLVRNRSNFSNQPFPPGWTTERHKKIFLPWAVSS